MGGRSEVHAWLLPHMANCVDGPFDDCQSLAARHRYENPACRHRIGCLGGRRDSWHRRPWNRTAGRIGKRRPDDQRRPDHRRYRRTEACALETRAGNLLAAIEVLKGYLAHGKIEIVGY